VLGSQQMFELGGVGEHGITHLNKRQHSGK